MFKKVLNSKTGIVVISLVGLYLLSTGTSWAVFSLLTSSNSVTPVTNSEVKNTRSKIDTSAPKTEECIINGKMFTKAEASIWSGRRPIVAMIENHVDSRPTQGLSKADVVYEAVAEGGITRYMGIFYCGAAAQETIIAPVRSSRIYYIDWASEYGSYPVYMHVGGANDFAGYGDTAKDVRALETLATIGWRVQGGNDFDTTFDSGYPVFYRDPERLGHEIAYEHQMVANLDKAYEQAEKRGFGATDAKGNPWSEVFVPWRFVDAAQETDAKAMSISFSFWDNQPDYDVAWKYDARKKVYLRDDGGKPSVDLEYDNEQLSASNVVVQLVKERGPVDRNKHMFYTTTGTGKAIIFQGGNAITGTWSKKSRTDRTRFYDANGKEIGFVRGVTWIEAIPAGNTVNYD